MRFWPQALLAFVVWVLLAWPVDVEARTVASADLLAGAVVAVLVAAVASSDRGAPLLRVLDPRRWAWAVVFLGVLAVHVLRANLDVARRVLTPSLPIRPGIVRIRTGLTSPAGQTLLANAITLTPGTLTVDVGAEPGVLYVHWIDVEQPDVQAATERIAGRFERLIARVVEGGRDA